MRDAEQFLAEIKTRPDYAAFLGEAAQSGTGFVARAPGRLDVMGGVADYSGALVAEATIREAALLALCPRTDNQVRVWSDSGAADGFVPQAHCTLESFSENGARRGYDSIRRVFADSAETAWAAYIFGCFYVLLAEGIVSEMTRGANLLLLSTVPPGAGVSSSAAIEVATMQALNVWLNLKLDGAAVARLAQIVENRVVGAPCGIMDQMTSALGQQNSLLCILCQPHSVQGTQSWPDGVRFFGINSNKKHSVGGNAYARARVAAFMGRKILGVDYLANVPDDDFYAQQIAQLPRTLSGQDFLSAYGETGDPVTRVDTGAVYPVQAATLHGIKEHRRVQSFLRELSRPDVSGGLQEAGALMYESHESYSAIGLGSVETDALAALARAAGPQRGIHGAKITGGGSGGTVAFLTYGADAPAAIAQIAQHYHQATGLTPQIFEAGHSPGALAFGIREWEN